MQKGLQKLSGTKAVEWCDELHFNRIDAIRKLNHEPANTSHNLTNWFFVSCDTADTHTDFAFVQQAANQLRKFDEKQKHTNDNKVLHLQEHWPNMKMHLNMRNETRWINHDWNRTKKIKHLVFYEMFKIFPSITWNMIANGKNEKTIPLKVQSVRITN